MRRALTLALTTALLTLLPSGAVPAAGACLLGTATIESTGGTVTGTEGDDIILVTGPATISALGGHDRICAVAGSTVDAGAGNDSLELSGSSDQPVEVDLGDGDDRLVVGSRESRPAVTGDVHAGDGRDLLELSADKRIDVDLSGGNVKVRQQHVLTFLVIDGFVDAVAVAPRVNVSGDRWANEVAAWACYATVHAGAGRDRVHLYAAPGSFRSRRCPTDRHARFFGAAGDDVLTGLRWSDRLVGGPGHDVAQGHGGRDECVAEVEVRC